MKIVLASSNPHKVKEINEIVKSYGINNIEFILPSGDFNPIETGTTFQENSLIKAKAGWEISKTWCLADDSGLCIDALDGKPGIYSARYAEEGKRCARVLSELEGIDDEKRTARFKCCICYIDEKGETHVVTGVCEGKIGYEKRGTNGFGYDPIFMYGDKSFAEISAEEKNRVSHRSDALRKFERVIKGEK